MQLPCGCDHAWEDCLCHCEDCQEEDSYVCNRTVLDVTTGNRHVCRGGYFCPHKEENEMAED